MATKLHGQKAQKESKTKAHKKTTLVLQSTTNFMTPNTLNNWRIYSPGKSMPGEVELPYPNSMLAMSFMAHADLNLNPIILRKNCIDTKYYSSYCVLTFRLPEPMTPSELDRAIENLGGVIKVFNWTPSMAVNFGRWSCYCSSERYRHPYFKMNVVTDDDGKFGTITVTVYEKRNLQCRDIYSEMDFYRRRKGAFLMDSKAERTLH